MRTFVLNYSTIMKSNFRLLVILLGLVQVGFSQDIDQSQSTDIILEEKTPEEGQIKVEEKVFQTFKDTRVINSPSVETLRAGKLDFRIGHRFGDAAGDAGGWPTFYGLEEAEDVLIGFDYGVTNNLMVGINRAKGSGPLRQNVNGSFKIRIIQQEINGNQPFSLALYGLASYSTMEKSLREDDLNFFAKEQHRLAYHLQMMLSRKFSPYFSLQVGGGWTYRNIVPFNDVNDLVHLSLASRIQMTKSLGIVLDAVVPFGNLRNSTDEVTGERTFYPAMGIGLEWETGGGHTFQMNFTNSTGMMETDYIPYTTSNWLDGEFRFGFTISRLFTI